MSYEPPRDWTIDEEADQLVQQAPRNLRRAAQQKQAEEALVRGPSLIILAAQEGIAADAASYCSGSGLPDSLRLCP